MKNFCSNCGFKLSEENKFCPGCGSAINEKEESTTNNTKKDSNVLKKQNSRALVSMILGIIAASWAFLELLSFGSIAPSIQRYYYVSEIVGFFIGFNILSLPCGIIGLIFGLKANIKSGKKTAGIVTSLASLVIVTISLIVILVSSM